VIIAMKPEPECLRCILSVRLREIESTSIPDKLKIQVAKELLKLLIEEFSLDKELTQLATITFRYVILKLPEVITYYEKIKSISNLQALRDLHVHEEYSARLINNYERFRYLVKLSGIANIIDYGVAEHSANIVSIDPLKVEKAELFIDHAREFYEVVRKGGLNVLWLFDNAGESIYDMLLIREIRYMGNSVYGFVKEDPGFQNDVTIYDAVSSGLTSALDGVVAYQGSTIHIENLSEEALKSIEKADLIVAKGMSHYEYLSEQFLDKPVVFILVAKCDPVASTIGAGSRGKIICLFRKTGEL
jgi:uncharacterized protein with ATP-grasp and redox domains